MTTEAKVVPKTLVLMKILYQFPELTSLVAVGISLTSIVNFGLKPFAEKAL
ncbi:hypothetical protein D3C72_2090090 [compost metagenome]